MRIKVATWNVHGCVGADGRFAVFRETPAREASDHLPLTATLALH